MQAAQLPPLAHASVALPHKPVAHTAENAGYPMFLAAWNRVADVMKRQPPGTRGWFGNHRLVMAPLGGELVLFVSPDIAGLDSRGLCTLKRAEDCADFTPEQLTDWTQRLHMWASQPLVNPPVAPEVVATSVTQQYGSDSPAYWHWDGTSLTTQEVGHA